MTRKQLNSLKVGDKIRAIVHDRPGKMAIIVRIAKPSQGSELIPCITVHWEREVAQMCYSQSYLLQHATLEGQKPSPKSTGRDDAEIDLIVSNISALAEGVLSGPKRYREEALQEIVGWAESLIEEMDK